MNLLQCKKPIKILKFVAFACMFFSLSLLIYWYASYQASIRQTRFPNKSTLARFGEIESGMNWQQVEKIIGIPFFYHVEFISRDYKYGTTTQSSMAQWEGEVSGNFTGSYSDNNRKKRITAPLCLRVHYRDGVVVRKEKWFDLWTMNLFYNGWSSD